MVLMLVEFEFIAASILSSFVTNHIRFSPPFYTAYGHDADKMWAKLTLFYDTAKQIAGKDG